MHSFRFAKLRAWILITARFVALVVTISNAVHIECNYEFLFGMKYLSNLLSLAFNKHSSQWTFMSTVAAAWGLNRCSYNCRAERLIHDIKDSLKFQNFKNPKLTRSRTAPLPCSRRKKKSYWWSSVLIASPAINGNIRFGNESIKYKSKYIMQKVTEEQQLWKW